MKFYFYFQVGIKGGKINNLTIFIAYYTDINAINIPLHAKTNKFVVR